MDIRLDLRPVRTPPSDSQPARERLGLPGGPVVMTGHQAEAWHPGIVAKFLAARAIADSSGGSVAWLTPDHAPTEPWRLSAPALRRERLVRRTLELAGANAAGVPVSLLEPASDMRIAWGDDEPALDSVRAGAEAHAKRLEARAGADNAAEQIVGAMQDAIGERGVPDAKAWASRLAALGALDETIERIAADPGGCVAAFNQAARARPEAGVAELRVLGDRLELPLWRLAGGMRRRVFSDELPEIDRSELAPRALLMTAVARLDLCDIFIHGTGGAAYDLVMESWIRAWLGDDAVDRLAPMAMATADVRLPLEEFAADDSEIDAAAWRAHHARHDPALLGDEASAEEKRRLFREIESAKRRGDDPSPLFHEMQALLKRVRAERAERLDELDEMADRAAKRRGSEEIARDRTWPILLHEPRAFDELAERVAAGVASGLRSSAPAPRG